MAPTTRLIASRSSATLPSVSWMNLLCQIIRVDFGRDLRATMEFV